MPSTRMMKQIPGSRGSGTDDALKGVCWGNDSMVINAKSEDHNTEVKKGENTGPIVHLFGLIDKDRKC